MPTDGNISPGPSATSCVAPQNSDAHLYNAADAARKSPLYSPSPRRYIETSYYYFMCPSYSYPIYTRTHIADWEFDSNKTLPGCLFVFLFLFDFAAHILLGCSPFGPVPSVSENTFTSSPAID
jgi:hypothetical protein